MQVKMLTTAIIQNIYTSTTQDTIMNRIVTDAQQTLQKEEKGLTALVSAILGALLWPLIILLIAGAIFFGITGKEGVKNLTKPSGLITIFVLIVVGIGLWLLWSSYRKTGPYTPREHWGCEKTSDGYRTGNCKQYDNSNDGPFNSQQTCQQALKNGVCDGFFGCQKDTRGFNTGVCTEFKNPLDGPFKGILECNNAVRAGQACQAYWGCTQDGNGFPVDPPNCTQYVNKPELSYPTQQECETASQGGVCRQFWNCLGSEGTTCVQDAGFGKFSTRDQCRTQCRAP
jgi:hypothetical protein